MKTISIFLIVAAVIQAALSARPATVSNVELISMSADQLVAYSLQHIIHDLDHKVPEVIKSANWFVQEIQNLIGATDAKEESKIKNLVDLSHAVEEYLQLIQEDTKTCGLRSIVWGKMRVIRQFVNRQDDEVFSLWARFEGETFIAIHEDGDPHKFIAAKVSAILEENAALTKQVDEKINEVASRCKSVEYNLIRFVHQRLDKFQ